MAAFLRTGTRWVLLLTLAAPAQGQENPQRLLLNAGRSVMDTVARLPKYVCTATIERSRYEPDTTQLRARGKPPVDSCDDIVAEVNSANWKQRLSSSDRVRLDVALSHDRSGLVSEMYSWVGDDRFSDRDLFEIVPDGAMSTGTFAAMLTSIFGGNATRFFYNGDTAGGEKQLSEFGFRVPEEKSHYLYVFGKANQEARVAYGGTLLVDPETSDLVRLVIRTAPLRRETGACELTRTVDYGRVRLHDADFLLPTKARISIVHSDETVAENVIHYSDCREFHSESAVKFEPLQETAVRAESAKNPPAPEAFALPPGLPFKLVFTDGINTRTAAAGDLVRAQLKTAIRDHSSNVLVPEGTPVAGRIVSIRRVYGQGGVEGRKSSTPGTSLVVAVKLETLDLRGKRRGFKAEWDTGMQRFVKSKGGLAVHVEFGSLENIQGSDAGVFEFRDVSPDYVVEAGLESSWRTLAPETASPLTK